MSFCTNCGNKLREGAKFCTNCGAPAASAATSRPAAAAGTAATAGTATAFGTGTTAATEGAQKTGNNTGKTTSSSSRIKVRTFKVGYTDYRKLNNVTLISQPSQHVVYHTAYSLLQIILLIYIVIVLLPAFIRLEGTTDFSFIQDMYPGMIVIVLLEIISGIIQRKILYDIIHGLPKGFDYWQIRRLIKWKIFGFESMKLTLVHLLQKKDCNFPELGTGTDDEGNYYAFAVAGEDVGRYQNIRK